MSNDTQSDVKQNPGGYVGQDKTPVVTQFGDDGIVEVSPNQSPAPAAASDDKADVSNG